MNRRRPLFHRLSGLLILLACACASRGPGADEPCSTYSVGDKDFKFKAQRANVEVKWFEELDLSFGVQGLSRFRARRTGNTRSFPIDMPGRCTRTALRPT